MRDDRSVALVVSCLSEGLLLVDGDRVERLDHVPSAGLAVGLRGIARAVHQPAENADNGEILMERGRRLRVAGLRDVHEVAWDDDLLACVSTLSNAVLWVDRRGEVVRRWQAAGEGDCWHLSGITVHGGRALVTAFGRFGRHRDWAEQARGGLGLVVEVPSGRVVGRGLSSPHSPRVLAGTLAVCDSARGELRVGSRHVRFGGWTRGLAATVDGLVVGVSAPRGSRGHAYLAFLRLSDLALLRRIPLPAREVFDIAELPAGRARTLARPGPTLGTTAPFSPSDLRAAVACPRRLRLPQSMLSDVPCVITNVGSSPLRSAPPYAVAVVAAWEPESRALWSPLPRSLEPGGCVSMRVRALAPRRPGRYELVIRVVQEGVAWFDGAARTEVTVD
jgi:hypothetical protein